MTCMVGVTLEVGPGVAAVASFAPGPGGDGGSMGRYVIRRMLQLIPVFFGTTFIIFAGVFMLPGDPIRALFGDRPPPPELVAELTRRYNLDDPLLIQYGKYISGI